MCGLAGVLYLDGRTATDADRAAVERMLTFILHRGPDQGRVIAAGPIVLGNRRLAILDLSPAGALPMVTPDGDQVLAYNGEVYNHPLLRHDLETGGERFISDSDAETLLKLHRRHGDRMLDRVRGMFAFVAYDAAQRRILIARDRAGEKPFFYYHDAEKLVFASEIKALLAFPGVPRRSALDARRLAVYLGCGYVPTPDTAFVDIHALPPGHLIAIDLNQPRIAPRPYWTPPIQTPERPVTPADEAEAAAAVLAALDTTVRGCLLSDVPLGTFLSGGLDSSLIAALMCRHTDQVRTFSIGFDGDASFDETPYAEQVAAHLGTQHTAFRVTPDALSLLPRLVWQHDQPFADSSAIPTYLVSQLTRQHVTVALTGDGGDELFAGYDRFYAAALVDQMRLIPAPLWAGAAALLGALPEGTGYYNAVKRVRRFVSGAARPEALAYFDWVRLFTPELTHDLIGAAHTGDPAGDDFTARYAGRGAVAALEANFRTYLPDDLLVKTDRSSMAVSLETRAPFLDADLITLAANLPFNLKLRGRTGKYILKQAARSLLPDSIIDRPKHGFGVPLGAWLKRDQAVVRDHLLSQRARQRGIVQPTVVERLIADHAAGRRDHGQRLWTLLTLENWFTLFIDPPELTPYA